MQSLPVQAEALAHRGWCCKRESGMNGEKTCQALQADIDKVLAAAAAMCQLKSTSRHSTNLLGGAARTSFICCIVYEIFGQP